MLIFLTCCSIYGGYYCDVIHINLWCCIEFDGAVDPGIVEKVKLQNLREEAWRIPREKKNTGIEPRNID